MKNIYLAGLTRGSYRTQNVIKYLLDNRYPVYYNSLGTTFLANKKGWILKLIRGINKVINLIVKSYYIALADIVIIPAMCNEFQEELLIANLFKKKIICDYYISFYDTFILDRETFPKDSRDARRLMNYDINLIKKATLTFFLNTVEAKRYLNLAGIPFQKNKHLILPLIVEEKTKCRLPYFNIPDNPKFNICWWGTYLPLHGLENIIESITFLKKNNKTEFHLYLFGTNDEDAVPYEKLISTLNLTEKITINNEMTFKNGLLEKFLREKCDLVLGNFGNSEKAKNVLVNKVLDGVAMQAPVLSGESKAPLEFFSERDIFYTTNSPQSIAEKIEEISSFQTYEVLNRTNRAYKIYKKNFSSSAFEKRLNKVFQTI